ncbi:MAG: hypothetical protein H6833_11805 [Planctomycetes bacterium]|nr:hypothetical protein [Planctomycetota bacterium]
MTTHALRLAFLFAIVTPSLPAQTERYVVLTGFERTDPYHAAAERLAAHHRTEWLIPFDPNAPEGALERLRAIEPTHVAIVLRPEQLHVNSVRAILVMATQVDADPFVDFDYAYVTGATAAEALQFVENVVRASQRELPRLIGQSAVWGGEGSSSAGEEPYVFGKTMRPSRSLRFRSPEGEQGRDQPFLDEHLTALEDCGAILMGGHGMPWEIVSGPQAADMAKLDLFPSVVFNYACYTGVTGTYAEPEYRVQEVVQHLKQVESERSFALTLLRRGVVGYTAYVTPRPAGPEMSVEFQRVLAGETMAGARRRDYAKVLLGYLGFGESGIVPPRVEEGRGMPRAELDSVRHLMLDAATGGITFGDPAYRPFPRDESLLPLKTQAKVEGDELHVRMTLGARAVYLWGADPFRRWKEGTMQMAMKLVDRVRVPESFGAIRSVHVERATWGGKAIETLPVVWAEEHDRGQRFLHVKANFEREMRQGDVVVSLIASPRELPAEVVRAQASREREAEATRTVRQINRELMRNPNVVRRDADTLRALGERGFEEVVALIRDGEAHYMTHRLFDVVRVDDGDQRLIALASGPALPNYGTWVVLRGLGSYDTPRVRAYLLDRLEHDDDAGTFMSSSEALVALRELRATPLIATRLLKFEPSFAGVQWQLVHAVGQLGGDVAVTKLTAYVLDERSRNEVAIAYALDHLKALDRDRLRQTIEALRATERYAGFSSQTKAHMETLGG